MRFCILPVRAFVALIVLTSATFARTIHVNDAWGNDEWTGVTESPSGHDGPLKTIQKAVDQAQPGDVINLAPGSGPYRDEVLIKKVSGTALDPITLEGNDCVIDVGLDVSNGPWEHINDAWVLAEPRVDPNAKELTQRALANFRGRPMYHEAKKTSMTQAGTVGVDDQGRMTFRFNDDAKPPFTGLIVPIRYQVNGVAFLGASYWHINNLHTRGAGNDGFNLHGRGEGIVIKNCSGMFCGDEGISSHDAMHVEVENSLFAFNASSVVDINRSVTSYVNCISAFNDAPGFSLVGEGGSYSIKDCLSAANRRAEVEADLPTGLVKVENLTTLPREKGVVEKIQAWNPDHPEMKLLMDTIATLRSQGADL